MDVGGAHLRYTFINVQNKIIESCRSPSFCLEHFKLKVPQQPAIQQSDNNNNSELLLPFHFINSLFLHFGPLVYFRIRMELMKINHIFVALFMLPTSRNGALPWMRSFFLLKWIYKCIIVALWIVKQVFLFYFFLHFSKFKILFEYRSRSLALTMNSCLLYIFIYIDQQ